MVVVQIIDSFDELTEYYGELVFADGFEDAFVGIVLQFNTPLACYDYDKCVNVLIKRDGMSREAALEFMEFNVVGAYVGERTPAFLNKYKLKGKVKK